MAVPPTKGGKTQDAGSAVTLTWKDYEQFGAHRPLPGCRYCRGTGVHRRDACICCFIPWGPNHPEPIVPAVKVRIGDCA